MSLRKFGNESRNLRWTVAFIYSFIPSLFFLLFVPVLNGFRLNWCVMFTVILGFNGAQFIFILHFLFLPLIRQGSQKKIRRDTDTETAW
jgi:hypothetical protein